MVRDKIFISYSHEDAKLFEELKKMLKPAIREGLVDIWDDTRIKTGAKWQDEISAALASASVAVLLVSDDFLDSEFIVTRELPRLLNADGVTVCWIYLGPCLYEHTEIASYQAAHDVSKSLEELKKPQRQVLVKQICEKLIRLAKQPATRRADDSRASGIAVLNLFRGARSSLLLGRDQELADLEAAWNGADRKNVVTIVAWGGTGKTALVANWAARKLDEPDRGGIERYFDWSFYSQGTRREGDATGADKEASADLFVKAALEYFGDSDLAASAASAWEKGERLARLIARQRTLLILDGLEPLQDAKTGELRDEALRTLLNRLAADNRGLCVVTTRQSVPELEMWRTTKAPEWMLSRLSTSAGSELLRQLDVKGTPAEREQLARDVKGHALTLALLGKYLVAAHGGDIRKWTLVSLTDPDSEVTRGHVFHVMEAYERWLEKSDRHAELAMLRLLGLFDRPATPDCVAALRQPPVISGLTETVVALTDVQMNIAVKRLVQLGIVEVQSWEPRRVLGYDEKEARAAADEDVPLREPHDIDAKSHTPRGGYAVDAHPLIREYFGRRLREETPAAWREAHGRLFEYLVTSVPYWPEGLDGLQPLYQAVAHGCQAGRYREARAAVYRDRILRGTRGVHGFYSFRRLGAVSANLAAVACFFKLPWKEVAPELSEPDQSWLLNDAAFCLQSLGRASEARDPMVAGLEFDIRQQWWENAAISAANVSELNLTLGDLTSAVQMGKKSVELADRSKTPTLQQGINRSWYANALHQAGQKEEARTQFEEAESMWAQFTRFPILYSVAGFNYCDLLLASAERSAWRRSIGTDNHDLDVVLSGAREVERRGQQLLEWSGPADSFFNIALNHLTLARAKGCLAILDRASFDACIADGSLHVEDAVQAFRHVRHDYLPGTLLTQAWIHVLNDRKPEAHADLAEAQQVAERGPMPLHLADTHLYRARLFFRDDLEAAREDLRQARKLIEKHGYLRRLPELEDAEEVIGK